MNDGDKVIYQPRITSDLRPGFQALVGRRLTVRGLSWLIEEEDGTPYTGEQAVNVNEVPYWIPSGDLVNDGPD